MLYIGIARYSLKERLLNNELKSKGHGTFFRNIGSILGYLPIVGSLKNKVNKSNYTFSMEDQKCIVDWVNNNLLVNWMVLEENLDHIEIALIKLYSPLLNISHNSSPNKELINLREKCLKIARG